MYAHGVNLFSEALQLTQHFKVFPLGSDGRPLPNCEACRKTGGNSCPLPADMAKCSCVTCHSFYRASQSPERVIDMLEWAGDDSLIGIATGHDFVVLDFDVHGEHDGRPQFREWADKGWLPPTVQALTGGGGCHLYYRTDAQVRTTVPPNTVGVDLKGVGGYVVAPPSAKEGKPPYRWRPGFSPFDFKMAELHPELLAAVRVKALLRHARNLRERPPGEAMERLARLEYLLGNFPGRDGNRNNWLFQAAILTGELEALEKIGQEYLTRLTECALGSGLSLSEVNATIESGLTRGRENIYGELS